MTEVRELGAAIAGCAAGAAVVLLAVGERWVVGEASRGEDLPVAAVALTGRDLAPATAGLALLALAVVAPLVATGGVVRRVVGVLTLGTGAAIAVLAARAGTNAPSAMAAAVPDATGGRLSLQLWPWLAAAGGLVVAAAGLLTAARSGQWPSMSRRYEAPQLRSEPVEAESSTPDDLWRALDRGEDPTRGP